MTDVGSRLGGLLNVFSTCCQTNCISSDLLWPSWSLCFCPLEGFCADSRSVPSFRSWYLFWKVQYLTSSTAAILLLLDLNNIVSHLAIGKSIGSRQPTTSRNLAFFSTIYNMIAGHSAGHRPHSPLRIVL